MATVGTLFRRLIGRPRSLRDTQLFHNLSLIAFFAWVGLGADGLSSSAYGPEEAFRHLGEHRYLAVLLALATAVTVFVISAGYTRIIEEFPSGGGGYLVATKLLGTRAGVVSGGALLVDYVLTIAVSVVSGVNAVFAFLPAWLQPMKIELAVFIILLLTIANLRGVKESVLVLVPIFLVFVITHGVLIVGSLAPHVEQAGPIVADMRDQLQRDAGRVGTLGLLLVFLRAYSMGGGTYTGIEAVSNGLGIMREPRVATGKRTMAYMAISLAITAAGILLAYLFVGIEPSPTKPMNAVLAERFAGTGTIGQGFVLLTLVSEALLLFVAAQTGFIGGPRVMANMALDAWLPRQLASLSERLTMHRGVLAMSVAAVAVVIYARGNIHHLVVMYSINVFLTFSLANLGMARLWLERRGSARRWARNLAVHGVALTLCAGVLVITVIEKFTQGGWLTLVFTAGIVAMCVAVKRHYDGVATKMTALNARMAETLTGIPDRPPHELPELREDAPTAVLMVGGYGGLGVQALLEVDRIVPGHFQQVVFLSVGVLDSGTFRGRQEMEDLRAQTEQTLQQYVSFARNKLGLAATYDFDVGADVVAELERLCREVYLRFPRSVFFAGKLIFLEPAWWHRLLHNETANAVQRRLEFDRLSMIVVPVRLK